MNGRTRHGMNDCGWDILPGNYYMFLEQIDADNTSLGMWRVGDFTSGKPGQFFGRFARTFSSSKGMNDMYFAVTGDVFADTEAETLNMRIVYYDKGSGGFSLLCLVQCSVYFCSWPPVRQRQALSFQADAW